MASKAAGPEDAGEDDKVMKDTNAPALPAATKAKEGNGMTTTNVADKKSGKYAAGGGTADPAKSLKPEDVASLAKSMGFLLIRV